MVRIQGTASEKDQLLIHAKVSTTWVSFNLVSDAKRKAKGPFSLDQGQSAHDLRLAFALAVDKKKLAASVCSNVACTAATGGLFPKGVTGYMGDDVDPLARYDPVKAKQLIQNDDPTGAKTQGLAYVYDATNPLNEPTARFLQSQWQDNLGVHVDLRAVSGTQFITSRLSGAYVLSRDGWKADYNYPQDWFDFLWGHVGAGCPDVTCSSGYDTKAYDDLLVKARRRDGRPGPFRLQETDPDADRRRRLHTSLLLERYLSVQAVRQGSRHQQLLRLPLERDPDPVALKSLSV